MTGLVLIGAALGVTLFAVVWLVHPPRTSPLAALAKFDALNAAPTIPLTDPAEQRPTLLARLGEQVVNHTQRLGITYTTLRQDLALTGRSIEDVMARKVVYGCATFVGCLAALTAAEVSLGAGLPGPLIAVISFVAGAAGYVLPDLRARAVARGRRVDFRRAVGAYLDLVSLEMAGSAAPAEALPNAARIGSGWPLVVIRDTLYRATRSGRDPWTALADLGNRIGVGELRDLGQLVSLVSHDGARVRETLTARAATIRRRDLADLAERAGKQDSTMQLAQVVIAFGFIVFIGYPAVAAILAF